MVSVSCFGVRFSVMFRFMFVHYTFGSVWVAEWPPFGKYEGHPINSGNFFIIRMLIRLAYPNYIVSMAKHLGHIIHCTKLISGQ